MMIFDPSVLAVVLVGAAIEAAANPLVERQTIEQRSTHQHLRAAETATSTTTSTSGSAIPTGLTQCIINCSTQAASSAGCSSYTDLSCVCGSSAFQTAAGACLVANCTAAEISSAQQIQQAECASFSNSTTSISSSASGSGSGSTPTSSSAATSSGAAADLLVPSFLDSAFGGLIALAGVFIGAAVVL